MSYYNHASMMAHRLGRWAEPESPGRPNRHRNHAWAPGLAAWPLDWPQFRPLFDRTLAALRSRRKTPTAADGDARHKT